MTTRKCSRFAFSAALLLCLLTSVYAAGGAELERAGHVLNRIGYGPSPADLARVRQIGPSAYIAEQLDPVGIDERNNVRLREKEDALFTLKFPVRETLLVMSGQYCRYRKGTSEPHPGWKHITFFDADWLRGPTGIGMGDGDDRTVLTDMRRINDDPDTPEDEWQQVGVLNRTKRPTAIDVAQAEEETETLPAPSENEEDSEPSLRDPYTFKVQDDAPPCADCGAIMVRSGTCYKCLNCGATSGCS